MSTIAATPADAVDVSDTETTSNSESFNLAGLTFPALTIKTAIVTLFAGALATIAFDLFGQALSPMAGFAKLAPVPLATQTWTVVFGERYVPGGHLLHYIAGLIAYPVGVVVYLAAHCSEDHAKAALVPVISRLWCRPLGVRTLFYGASGGR